VSGSMSGLLMNTHLRPRYTILYGYFTNLKTDYDAAQDVIKRISEELADIRRSAMDAAQGVLLLTVVLSTSHDIIGLETTENLSRREETNALIEELQSDRSNGPPSSLPSVSSTLAHASHSTPSD
jgi:hypothetical protein